MSHGHKSKRFQETLSKGSDNHAPAPVGSWFSLGQMVTCAGRARYMTPRLPQLPRPNHKRHIYPSVRSLQEEHQNIKLIKSICQETSRTWSQLRLHEGKLLKFPSKKPVLYMKHALESCPSSGICQSDRTSPGRREKVRKRK